MKRTKGEKGKQFLFIGLLQYIAIEGNRIYL